MALRSVEVSDGVLGIPGVLVLDECESGGVPGDPDVFEGPVLVEGGLEVIFGCVVPEVPDVDLALDVPVPVT